MNEYKGLGCLIKSGSNCFGNKNYWILNTNWCRDCLINIVNQEFINLDSIFVV